MKLSIVEKIGFGAGDMAINVVIIAMQLLLAYFYTDIYGRAPLMLAYCLWLCG